MTLSSWRVRGSFAALLICSALAAAGCGRAPLACPAIVLLAPGVTVVDAASGTHLCDVTVVRARQSILQRSGAEYRPATGRLPVLASVRGRGNYAVDVTLWWTA